eukprot:CAMPEP_0113486126 /NCGR_PEP_ID=MMETSP0014_2-20120614/24836_1 /TAXON_ID=2857 /ORGANISM="Nitzschia sp." /LENGTH=722 /DNA_ID=CAMNT_0000379789 /DNA_START=36 /DNA_END=2201 /DNA_ORIENTATION=- /assembly_acc=CAM_ASM_000159
MVTTNQKQVDFASTSRRRRRMTTTRREMTELFSRYRSSSSSSSKSSNVMLIALVVTIAIKACDTSSCCFYAWAFTAATITSTTTSTQKSFGGLTRAAHAHAHAQRATITPRLSARGLSSESNDDQEDGNDNYYDLAVVGGGVVGVQAALLAAASSNSKNTSSKKLRVCLIDAPEASGALLADNPPTSEDGDDNDGVVVEKEDLSLGGPTGLFSKALRDTSKQIKVDTLRGMGLRDDSIFNEIINACVDLARSNARDVQRELEFANVDYIRGYASFASSLSSSSSSSSSDEKEGDEGSARTTLQVEQRQDTKMVHASRVLLATGSQPFRPNGIPFDGKRIFDSDSINTLGYLPRSIAITGSGIIAIEFAKIFRNLGADVTLIIRDEIPRRALQKIGLDIDVAATLVADLVRCGIKIERGAQAGEFTVPSNPRSPVTIELRAKGGAPRKAGLKNEIKCDCYLAAVGRKPNTNGLNLDAAGVETDEYGGILVDSTLRTTSSCRNVFAAGDVLGRPFLASTGTAQGRAAVSSMFPGDDTSAAGQSSASSTSDLPALSCDPDDPTCVIDGISQAGTSFDPASLSSNPFAFPTGVWSSPEAAYFGLSKSQAKDMGIDAGEGMALYAECLRGRVFSPNGLLKLVFEKSTGRIVGVHICGEDACELIHYGMELVKSRRTIEDLNNSLYSAVTFHEMYKIAAQNALDEVGARKRRAAAGKALAARQRSQAK